MANVAKTIQIKTIQIYLFFSVASVLKKKHFSIRYFMVQASRGEGRCFAG